MTLLAVFSAVFFLYVLLLFISKGSEKICAICLAVAIVWAGLLVGYSLELFDDVVVLGLLIGQSIAGGYYLLFKKLEDRLKLFQLPVLLTLTLIAYSAITWRVHIEPLIFLAVMWLAYGGVFLYMNNPSINKIAKKIIECCSKW